MARVVKNKKQQKANVNKKPFIIGGSVAGVIALTCLIVGLVVFFNSLKVVEKYTDSRSISFETLEKLIDKGDPTSTRYEMEVYVYVFNSDVKSNPNSDVKESLEELIQLSIDYDNQVQGFNIPKDQTALGFYTLDLYDEDNIGILNNSNFGNQANGPFLIKLQFNTNGSIFQEAVSTDRMVNYMRDYVVAPLYNIVERNSNN